MEWSRPSHRAQERRLAPDPDCRGFCTQFRTLLDTVRYATGPGPGAEPGWPQVRCRARRGTRGDGDLVDSSRVPRGHYRALPTAAEAARIAGLPEAEGSRCGGWVRTTSVGSADQCDRTAGTLVREWERAHQHRTSPTRVGPGYGHSPAARESTPHHERLDGSGYRRYARRLADTRIDCCGRGRLHAMTENRRTAGTRGRGGRGQLKAEVVRDDSMVTP